MSSPKPKSSQAWLYFQVAFAATVWGGAYPFTKQLVTEISPLSIVTFRALVGALALVFLSRSRLKLSDFNPGALWKLLVLSVLGVSTQQYLQAYALKYTLASHAGWLIASTPIMVAGLMAALGERLGPFKIAAFLAGCLGALLVVFSHSGAGAFSLPSTHGDLVFLTTCASWAVYVILTKKWLTAWPQAKVTTLTMLVALLTVLPPWLLSGGAAEFARVSARGWLSLAYLSLLSSALAYLFWNNAVEGLGAVKTSYFIYLEPFSTLLSSYLLLGEKAAAPAFAGGLLILAGVYLLGLNKKKMEAVLNA
ncbi:MAG TPA: DMT family transporter [Elusimicrobiales bacterium]|nr:DMT family transporter [Elusimicrobiales bacterium]